MSFEYHRASEYTTFRVCKCVSICYAGACDSACVRYIDQVKITICKAYVKNVCMFLRLQISVYCLVFV